MATRFSGKTAIVTGAGRGIGAATALLLAREGARVLITARTRAELEAVASQAPGMIAAPADVSDERQVRELFDRVERELGPVDILVNNAALFIGGQIAEFSVEDWDRTMAVNLRGPFLCSREAMRRMKGRGGAIVNLSSLGGIRATEKFPGTGAYATSKAGIVALTEVLAVEGKPDRIRVNCVAPGAVDTKMLRDAAPHLKTETKPEDVARIIATLCDDRESRALTGSVIEIFSNA